MALAIPRQQLRLKLSQLSLHIFVICGHRYRLIIQVLHLSGLPGHHAIIYITISLLLYRDAILTDIDLMAHSKL